MFRFHNSVDFYSFDILCFICLFYLLDLYEVCKYLFLVNCFFKLCERLDKIVEKQLRMKYALGNLPEADCLCVKE